MSTWEKRFQKNPNMVSRKIDQETILVPVVSNTADMDSIYTLNEMSTFIWEQIDGKNQLGDILAKINQEFEVEPERAERDLLEFIKDLLKVGAIKEVHGREKRTPAPPNIHPQG